MPITISRMLTPLPHLRSSWNRFQKAKYARRLRSMMGTARWCIDHVDWGETELTVIGWALPPAHGSAGLEFRINQKAFEDVQYPTSRAYLAKPFWFLPNASESGFRCRIPTRQLGGNCTDNLHLQLVDRRSGEAANPYCSYYFPGKAACSLPLPDSTRQQRVHGHGDESTFQSVGFSTFVTFEQ